MSEDTMPYTGTVEDLTEVYASYVKAMLRASSCNGMLTHEHNTTDPSDCDASLGAMLGMHDLAPETQSDSLRDVVSFCVDNRADLIGMDCGQIGHDLWLTRNHHGAGFWDRGLGERGQRLTDAAHAWSEVDAYVGDDGRVYVQ